MTVAVSFGAERDAAFEHAKNRCVVSMPQVRTSKLRYLFHITCSIIVEICKSIFLLFIYLTSLAQWNHLYFWA